MLLDDLHSRIEAANLVNIDVERVGRRWQALLDGSDKGFGEAIGDTVAEAIEEALNDLEEHGGS